jgi:hypothetical protein
MPEEQNAESILLSDRKISNSSVNIHKMQWWMILYGCRADQSIRHLYTLVWINRCVESSHVSNRSVVCSMYVCYLFYTNSTIQTCILNVLINAASIPYLCFPPVKILSLRFRHHSHSLHLHQKADYTANIDNNGVVVSTLASCARDRGSIPGYAATQAIRMRL